MGIFDKIKNAIWGSSEPQNPNSQVDTSAGPIAASAATIATIQSVAPAPAIFASAERIVDIESVLDAAVIKKGQKLNWRTSIVDLMKSLNLDSSFSNRKQLASELGYDGNMKNSSKMNVWLHKQVLLRLKDSGGKLPPEFH
jgi:hypothetical protein